MSDGKLAVIMPLYAGNNEILKLSFETVLSIRSPIPTHLFVPINRLDVMDINEFRMKITEYTDLPVTCFNNKHDCVSGSWNKSIKRALFDKEVSKLLIIGNDVILDKDTIKNLLSFDNIAHNADIWSALDKNDSFVGGPTKVFDDDSLDFSCAMFTRETFNKHKEFDENFRPAYFEDDDYYARIILSGGNCIKTTASYYHYRSMTVRMHPELKNSIAEMSARCKSYFCKKWGVKKVAKHKDGVLESYYKTPFNHPDRPLSYWPDVFINDQS